MNRTIRDYIKRRVRATMLVAVGGWLFMVLAGLVAERQIGQSGNPIPLIIGFALFGGAILWMTYMLKCPKCGASLRQIAMEIGLRFGSSKRRLVRFCPYCGADIDQPYEPPRSDR
jgi:hypothetical protein